MPQAPRLLLAALLAAAAPAHAQNAPRPSQPAPARPAADTITEATLSKPSVKAIYDAARIPARIDPAGNLALKLPQTEMYVLVGTDHIRLMARYAFAPRTAMQERLDLANRINDGYIMARATIPPDSPGELVLDHYLLVGPGLPRAILLAATRRFAEIAAESITTLDTDNLLK